MIEINKKIMKKRPSSERLCRITDMTKKEKEWPHNKKRTQKMCLNITLKKNKKCSAIIQCGENKTNGSPKTFTAHLRKKIKIMMILFSNMFKTFL